MCKSSFDLLGIDIILVFFYHVKWWCIKNPLRMSLNGLKKMSLYTSSFICIHRLQRGGYCSGKGICNFNRCCLLAFQNLIECLTFPWEMYIRTPPHPINVYFSSSGLAIWWIWNSTLLTLFCIFLTPVEFEFKQFLISSTFGLAPLYCLIINIC